MTQFAKHHHSNKETNVFVLTALVVKEIHQGYMVALYGVLG